MADIVKQILARPIQLADQVTKLADEAHSFKQDCQELKAKTEKLAMLLRQVARASNELYVRPTRRIMDNTEQVLHKALTLVVKCRANGFMKRIFTTISTAAFRKTSLQLENSIGDVSWLLRALASVRDHDDKYLGLPPIAANEPILCLIWEQIAVLCTGSLEDRCDAAASLISLAKDNVRCGKLIIEEGGVAPLLKLVKEGRIQGQENAARAIGLLGRDSESVEHIVKAGVCNVFAKILKEGHMIVQVVVAWAVSELAKNCPKCQDHFAQSNIIRFLIRHLAFGIVQDKYASVSKQAMSMHSVVMASNNPNPGKKIENEDDDAMKISHLMNHGTSNQMHNVVNNTMATKNQTFCNNCKPTPTHSPGMNYPNQVKGNTDYLKQEPHLMTFMDTSIKRREIEDPETKANMKAMAARALWQLSKGNLTICRAITESRALLCFAILLDKGPSEVQYYSAMALMEITAIAEQNADLRRSSFKPTSPAVKAVVEQLFKVIEKEDSELLVPCIKSIGHLARTFRATETRIFGQLVKLLDEREPEVTMEAAIALKKFATTKNFLRVNHSKEIINAGGTKHLIQLVYFSQQMVQIPSLILLCYIALNCPDSEVLANEEILTVLEWSSKQGHLIQEPTIGSLLPEAESRLDLYQSRASRTSH